MIKIDDKEIRKFERELKAFAHRAYPFATKNTLNKTAFHAQKLIRRDLAVKMVLRNKFTIQSIRVEQTKTLNLRNQASVVGSTADYMEDQEFGVTKQKKGIEGVPIATGYAAGQQGHQPRTRLPRKPNKLRNIRLRNKRRQNNIQIIHDAAISNNKFIFLNLGRTKGIFKVIGGKRKPRIKMIWSLTQQSIVIPRNPWLKPAVDTAAISIPKFYRDALIFQLRRLNLFKR